MGHKKILAIVISWMLILLVPQTSFSKANKSLHWGFKKAKNEQQAEAGAELDSLLQKYDAIYKSTANKKDIYLTFDNGYENGFTEQILDVLKTEQVPATFFVTGHYLKTAPDLVKRMVTDGHIIGNHSWDHPDLTKVSEARFKKELAKVKQETEKLTGVETMNYLRPPRGIFSEQTLSLAKDLGYTHIFWSLAFIDWHVNHQKGWQYAYNEVMKQIHPGAILLLHTVSRDNADALQKIITDLKKRGYTFKSLDELMVDRLIDEELLFGKG